MPNKHNLVVSSITRETEDCISIGFDIPVHLSDDFDYEPGQYITLEIAFEEGLERRAYSISSSALTDNELRISVKKLQGGKVSTYLLENSKVGMKINVLGAEGNFTPELRENATTKHLLIAAGSGITPIMSILKSILAFEKKSTVHLLYGNRSESEIIFNSQLAELEKQYPKRLAVVHALSNPTSSWEGHKGRVSDSLIHSALKEDNPNHCDYSIFVCGPSGLIETAEEALVAKGFKKEHVKREYFIKEKAESKLAQNNTGSKKLTIVLDNEEHEIQLEGNTTVLEAAIDAGLDAPYSCKIAACCTCRAKVKSGTVEMEDDEILTEAEIAEGFILTCQAIPTSSELVVSYDEG